jgi:hypothetical protein
LGVLREELKPQNHHKCIRKDAHARRIGVKPRAGGAEDAAVEHHPLAIGDHLEILWRGASTTLAIRCIGSETIYRAAPRPPRASGFREQSNFFCFRRVFYLVRL